MSEWLTVDDAASRDHAPRATASRTGRWAAWAVPVIYLGCIAAFIADLTSTNELAFGVFYAPLVATAVFYKDKRAVWVLTAIGCAMNIIGAFFPNVAVDVSELAVNRTLSSIALLATAAFTWHARSIQERLTAQTERAEAAERVKSEVLTRLSEEIRAPLTSMIGILELAATDSRPDHKEALTMARSAGRCLAMTIDNLVDLTQFDGKPVPGEKLDLGLLLRQTAEARRQDASARQINLTIDIPPNAEAMVDANPWATRRILENKLTDAITYTAPGGRIEVSTDAGGEECSAVIATTGAWPPSLLRSADDVTDALLTPSTMGLVLSQRLAQAMNARLVFSSGPNEETTVRLCLPAVARP